MPIFLGILGASLLPVVVPYFLPAPAPQETTNDRLFRYSLIAGIIISGFTIYSYVKGA